MYKSLMKITSNVYIRWIVIGLLSLMAVVSVVQGVRNAVDISQDFQWDAAKALMEGIDPYRISLDSSYDYNSEGLTDFYRLFTDAGVKQKMEANQFPSLLMLLAPFTMFAPLTARYMWVVANLIFTVGIVFLLRKTFLKNADKFEFAVIILLMLAGTPYRNQVGVGQHTLFSFCFFLMAVYFDEMKPKGNSVAVTICMFVSYFKYTLTAPLTLYLLYRRRFKEFVISIVMHVILTIVAAVKLGTSVVYMITAPLQVSSMLSAEGGLDLGALFAGRPIYLVIGALVVILLLYIAIKMPEGRGEILFASLLLWSLILVYHRTYDFFVLVAVPVIFISVEDSPSTKSSEDSNSYNDNDELFRKITRISYYCLIMMVYFGLRLFNENIPSRICVGIIYYIFTVYVTYLAIRQIGAIKK